MNKFAPIALFTYNRLWHTQQTVDALKENIGSDKSDLFIFSDGAKNETDKTQVDVVRAYLKVISGFKSVKIIEQEKNLGLANSIITGVTKIVNEFDRVIVLEDDLITSPYFLTYMNDGLNLYADENAVASIHGYRYPIGKIESSFFMRGADCWGWATWKRAWDNFESDGAKLLSKLEQNGLIKAFNHHNSFPYDKMLKDQIAGKNNSWAVRWKASAFLNNQYTLYYKESLVQNIGHDNSGTHSQESKQFKVNFTDKYEELKPQAIEENKEISDKISAFYKSTRPTFWQKLKAKFF